MISRRIVREFGGELSATHNADAGGATFVIDAARAAPAPQPVHAQETTA
jgi:C4-dicarboxylate-specific signal transduction histidine kinase